MSFFGVARRVRRAWVWLLLATLVHARDLRACEERKGSEQSVSELSGGGARVHSLCDPASSSFYIDVKPFVDHRTPMQQLKDWFRKNFVPLSACLSLSLIHRYFQNSAITIPMLGALTSRPSPAPGSFQESYTEEKVHSIHFEESFSKRSNESLAWFGKSLLVFVPALAAPLCGMKAGRAASHRRHSGLSLPKLTPRSALKTQSRLAALPSRGSDDDLELASGGAFLRQQTEPSMPNDTSRSRQRKASPDSTRGQRRSESAASSRKGSFLRQCTGPSTQGRDARRNSRSRRRSSKRSLPQDVSEANKLECGTGGFVRQKTEELESRIDSAASKMSMQVESDERGRKGASEAAVYRISTDADERERTSKAAFYRISTEGA